MNLHIVLPLLLALAALQTSVPPYVRQGDTAEQQFRQYHEKLDAFYRRLHAVVKDSAPALTAMLEGEPPRPVVFGYQMLPKLFDEPADTGRLLETRSYSWPLTEGYIRGESIKLDLAGGELNRTQNLPAGDRHEPLRAIIRTYRELVANQKTVDQHIEYNRFWQRVVASDRERYDQLTKIFKMLEQRDPDVNGVIREALGKPDVPAFIRAARPSPGSIVLQVPVYTDIEDPAFLAKVKTVTEDFWQVREDRVQYRVEVEWRKTTLRNAPKPGAHLDLRAHAARFPSDGAVLTTGAESTYAVVGRFVALGPADMSYRTIAHEFGHVLGFRDGYVRGYKDLGNDGFEIMELIPNFDDLMSSPRQGNIRAAHFKLLLAGLHPGN